MLIVITICLISTAVWLLRATLPQEALKAFGYCQPVVLASAIVIAYVVVPSVDLLFLGDSSGEGSFFGHAYRDIKGSHSIREGDYTAILMLLLGVPMFFIAYRYVVKRNVPLGRSICAIGFPVQSPLLWHVAIALYSIYMMAHYYCIYRVGVETYYSIHWSERSEYIQAHAGLPESIIQLSEFFAYYLNFIVVGLYAAPTRPIRIACIALLAHGTINIVLDGTRQPLLDLGICFIVCDFFYRRSTVSILTALSMGILLIVFLGDFRSAMHNDVELGMSRYRSKMESLSADEIFVRDFEVFNAYDLYLEEVRMRPKYKPYLNGETLVKALVFWIPRSLFPSKPASYTVIVAQDMNCPAGVSLSAGLHSEGYSNFGFPGLWLVFIFAGAVTGGVQRLVNRIPACDVQTQATMMPIIGAWSCYLVFMLRWPFSDGMLRYILPISLLVIALKLAGLRVPAPLDLENPSAAPAG